MKLYEIIGTYGSQNTPSTVFVAEVRNGCWYVCEGSKNVNFTPEPELTDGTDVEELRDTDMFTWPNGVHSLEELEKAIEA